MAEKNEIKLGTRVIKVTDAIGWFPELIGVCGSVIRDHFGEGPTQEGCMIAFDNGASEWLYYENIEVLKGDE